MEKQQYELIESSKQYTLKLMASIKKEIDVFRIGTKKDISNLLLIAEGVQYVLKVLSLTTNYYQENDKRYSTVIESLRGLSEAIENGDFIAITDNLEYEFIPLMEEWVEVFNKNLNKIVNFPG